MTQCGGPMSGGRRRKSRKMKGGNFYGFTGALDGTTAGAGWGGVVNASAKPDGTIGPADTGAMNGGRRRSRRSRRGKSSRKGKALYGDIFRGGKKSRRGTRRKMYGGASQFLPAKSGAGFTGEGAARGMGGYVDVGGSGPMPNNVVPLA